MNSASSVLKLGKHLAEALPDNIQQDTLPMFYDMTLLRVTRACAICGARIEMVIPHSQKSSMNDVPELYTFRRTHGNCKADMIPLPDYVQDFLSKTEKLFSLALSGKARDIPPLWIVPNLVPNSDRIINTIVPSARPFTGSVKERNMTSRTMALMVQTQRNLEWKALVPPNPLAAFAVAAWQLVHKDSKNADLSIRVSESDDRQEIIMLQVVTPTAGWFITYLVDRDVRDDDTSKGVLGTRSVFPSGTMPALDGVLLLRDDYVSPANVKPQF